MLVVRAYPVMGVSVVEVTCCGHGEHPGAGAHMLLRTELDRAAESVGEMLRDLADVLDFAHREWAHGDLDVTDDCAW